MNGDDPEKANRWARWLHEAARTGKQPMDSYSFVKPGAPWHIIKELNEHFRQYLGINGQPLCQHCMVSKEEETEMIECKGCNGNFHRTCLTELYLQSSGRKRHRLESSDDEGESEEEVMDCPKCGKANFLAEAWEHNFSSGHRCSIIPLHYIILKLHNDVASMNTQELILAKLKATRHINALNIEMQMFLRLYKQDTYAESYPAVQFIVSDNKQICMAIHQAIERVYKTACMIKDQHEVASNVFGGRFSAIMATGMSLDFSEAPFVNQYSVATDNPSMQAIQLMDEFFFAWGIAYDKHTQHFYAKNRGGSYFSVGDQEDFLIKMRALDYKFDSIVERFNKKDLKDLISKRASFPTKQLPSIKLISWYVVFVVTDEFNGEFVQGAVYPPCLVSSDDDCRFKSSPEPFFGPPDVANRYVRHILTAMNRYKTADSNFFDDESTVVAPINLLGPPQPNRLFTPDNDPIKVYKPTECDLFDEHGRIVDPPKWKYTKRGSVQVNERGEWVDCEITPPGFEGGYKLRPRMVPTLFEGPDFNTPTKVLDDNMWHFYTPISQEIIKMFANTIGVDSTGGDGSKLAKLVRLHRCGPGKTEEIVNDRFWHPFYPETDEVMDSYSDRMNFDLMKGVNKIKVWNKEESRYDCLENIKNENIDDERNPFCLDEMEEGEYYLKNLDQVEHQHINPLFLPAKVLIEQMKVHEALIAMSFVGDRIYSIKSDPNRFGVCFVGQSGTGKTTLAYVIKKMQGAQRIGELMTSQKGQFNLQQLFKGKTVIVGEDLQPMQKDSSIGPKEFQSLISGEDMYGQVKNVQDHSLLKANIRCFVTANYPMIYIWPKGTDGAAADAVNRRFFQINFGCLRNDNATSASQEVMDSSLGSIFLVMHWCYRVRLFAQRDPIPHSMGGFKLNQLEPTKDKPTWVPSSMQYRIRKSESPFGLAIFDQIKGILRITGVTNLRADSTVGDCESANQISLTDLMFGPKIDGTVNREAIRGLKGKFHHDPHFKVVLRTATNREFPKPEFFWKLLVDIKKELINDHKDDGMCHYVLVPPHTKEVRKIGNTDDYFIKGVTFNDPDTYDK